MTAIAREMKHLKRLEKVLYKQDKVSDDTSLFSKFSKHKSILKIKRSLMPRLLKESYITTQ